MLVAGHAFNEAARDAGWPERMNALQLAALQRPRHLSPAKIPIGGASDYIAHFPRSSDPENQSHRAMRNALLQEFESGAGPDTPQAFASWLAAQGEAPSIHIQAWFEAAGMDGAAPAKPLQRNQAQSEAILHELKKQGYDPLALPKNPPGKPGVKAAVRKAIDGRGIFTGKTVFSKSWEHMRTAGEIADHD